MVKEEDAKGKYYIDPETDDIYLVYEDKGLYFYYVSDDKPFEKVSEYFALVYLDTVKDRWIEIDWQNTITKKKGEA